MRMFLVVNRSDTAIRTASCVVAETTRAERFLNQSFAEMKYNRFPKPISIFFSLGLLLLTFRVACVFRENFMGLWAAEALERGQNR